jgi:hypothetical protein
MPCATRGNGSALPALLYPRYSTHGTLPTALYPRRSTRGTSTTQPQPLRTSLRQPGLSVLGVHSLRSGKHSIAIATLLYFKFSMK